MMVSRYMLEIGTAIAIKKGILQIHGNPARMEAKCIQGVLGEGTLGYKVMLITYRVYLEKTPWFPKFGVSLVMVTRMDVLMCFQADILLEIPRRSKWEGMVPSVGMDPGEYCT